MQNLYTRTGYSTQRDGKEEPYIEAYASDVHNQRRANVHIYRWPVQKLHKEHIYIYMRIGYSIHRDGK